MEVELRDPVEIFTQLSVDELTKLRQDIDAYLQLEIKRNGEFTEFWTALADICKVCLEL